VIDHVKASQTMMEAHDRMYVEQSNYARTIRSRLGVGTTEFDLSKERALVLYDLAAGRRRVSDKWDF
jgi:hypothetical protein